MKTLDRVKIADDYRELKYLTRDLLWSISNQREKVKGNLKSIVDTIYPDCGDDTKWDIVEKVMKNIK